MTALKVNIQKDAAKSRRGCQRYCMRMSCQDAGAMRMSSFHFTRRYFPEIYVERGHLPPKPRDCARRITIRIKKVDIMQDVKHVPGAH